MSLLRGDFARVLADVADQLELEGRYAIWSSRSCIFSGVANSDASANEHRLIGLYAIQFTISLVCLFWPKVLCAPIRFGWGFRILRFRRTYSLERGRRSMRLNPGCDRSRGLSRSRAVSLAEGLYSLARSALRCDTRMALA